MNRLENKTAVITGATSGIGFASARRFIAEGSRVFIMGRRQEVLDKALAELGSQAKGVCGDVSSQNDLDRLFDFVESEGVGIDILFANAGIGSTVPLGQITEEHFNGIFDVNVKGTLFTVQKALPLMKRGGSIIMTGSTTGSTGTPAFSVYSASKAAIRSFARVWAQDLRGTGIRINVLSPGATETDALLDITGKEGAAAMSQHMPLERLGETTELAAVAAFLASDDSSFMTGSEVFADGGQAQI